MSSVSIKNTVIDQEWLSQNKNNDFGLSLTNRGIGYVKDPKGAYRSMGLLKHLTKLGRTVGEGTGLKPSANWGRLERNLGIGMSALGIARLPSMAQDAVGSLAALTQSGDGIGMGRKVGKAVENTMDFVSSCSYSAVFVTGNPAVLPVAQITDLTAEVTGFSLATSDYSNASDLEARATGEAKEALRHSKNFYFLCMLKTASAIATAILGFVLVTTSFPLMPSIALIIVFMSPTVFAILRDNYKGMGQYKVVEFDRKVKLSPCSMAKIAG